jgi:hypothetical protein
MTETSTAEPISIEPIPAPSLDPHSTNATAALKRCCAAWRRAYNAKMEEMEGTEGNELDMHFASKPAGEAYCKAMPLLSGDEGIRDFIACTAHGILIGAITHEKSGQLLYAAQVALATLNQKQKLRKSRSV